MSRHHTPDLASLIESFFTRRLLDDRRASPHTVAAYRDTFRLLLSFAQQHLHRTASSLNVDDLDVSLIRNFLRYLEKERGNTSRTRNARLAAIHSFFKYVALEDPLCATVAQRVLSLPSKRAHRGLIEFLVEQEIEAILGAVDLNGRNGSRDHALLLVAIQTGMRVSELTSLDVRDAQLGPAAHIRCHGKGRKSRCTPLRRDALRAVRRWLREYQGEPDAPLFPNSRGTRLTRDGVDYLLGKYVAVAARTCKSLRQKRVTPHVLRHTAAMILLEAGLDRSVIALWLGHETAETTDIYFHADMKLKERALARTAPVRLRRKRFRPSDRLLAFLEAL
jgi:site-specific recombinase XerD